MSNSKDTRTSVLKRLLVSVLVISTLGAAPGALAQYLEWEPAEMFFENVPVGETRWLTLTLTARDAPVSVGSIHWTYNQPGFPSFEPQFAFVPDRVVPTSLLPDESMEVYISFTPEEAFTFASAVLSIPNSSLNEAPLDYFIEGSSTEPDSCSPLTSCLGICTDINNDVNNCGMCGNVCPMPDVGLPFCITGVCNRTCDVSIDLNTDPDHCGACDNVCEAPANGTPVCEDGSCGFVCNEGYEQAGDTCQAIGAITPQEMIDSLVVFAQESRDTGTLLGLGPSGKDQQGSALLNVFMRHLEKAQTFIEAGEMMEACGRLNFNQLRSDGGWPFIMPPDFVAGEAVSEIHDRIIELMGAIEGCEPTEAPTRP